MSVKVELECTYCGRKWEEWFYSQADIIKTRCMCGDNKLKFRDALKPKIDYYGGSPSFPEDNKEDDYYGSSD